MNLWTPSIVVGAALWTLSASGADQSVPLIRSDQGGLVYELSIQGDRVPDFSYCGYMASAEAIPAVATRLRLTPSGGDDTRHIQAALDHLSQMAVNESGWHGALQLSTGDFLVNGTLKLRSSNVVLRGTVEGEVRTKIIATGNSRRPLIVVGNDAAARDDSATADGDAEKLLASARVSERVPIGSMSVSVAGVDGFHVGQRVRVIHPSTPEWIDSVGMNRFPSDDGRGSWLDWKPGTVDQVCVRTITAIDAGRLVLDAPITSVIDPAITAAVVVADRNFTAPAHIGVEYLELVSEVDTRVNAKNEEHAWDGIRFLGVTDAWVRSVSFKHFAGSAVHVGRNSQRVTVMDCASTEPVSEDAGWRRHTFYTIGQQTLFVGCRAQGGRHDFATGHLTSGPNAFVSCSATEATEFSGPIGSWASGVLYDNVEIDGAALALTNRETTAQGTGWSAANCVLWNCVAPKIVCRSPPTGFNWAIGVWGEVVGDGIWRELNQFVQPDSLFEAQLSARIGNEKAQQVLNAAVSYPSWDESNGSEFVRLEEYPIASEADGRSSAGQKTSSTASKKLHLQNGWLAIGDELAIGSRTQLNWWRGSVLESKVKEFGPSVTRFVPGRDEPGYTDDLKHVAQQMHSRNSIVLEHHWGLWYDRRRDDHQMVRRTDGEAWPPFYEQPWARSGQGRAWDGLSKYDLTRFNDWYFDRLHQFAEQADEQGLILMQYMYFQHNVLEAGAHWADFPWRPANCLQDTGFPEPPQYVNRKRVFMAEAFYDVSHLVRRDLHTRYIRHCLDTLGKHTNVLFVLGEEFTGPIEFVRFWLETVAEWELEQGREVLTVLSVPRDVQVRILEDSKYEQLVDVIDIKYWWYTSNGNLYDPPSAQNLAPRQQLREWKQEKGRSPASVMRSVGELRTRFPKKAVICSLAGVDAWAVVAAGGSLAELPSSTDVRLRRGLLKCVSQQDVDSHYSLVRNGVTQLKTGAMDQPFGPFDRIDRTTGLLIASQEDSVELKADALAPIYWRREE